MAKAKKVPQFQIVAVGANGLICKARGSIGYQVRASDFSFRFFTTDLEEAKASISRVRVEKSATDILEYKGFRIEVYPAARKSARIVIVGASVAWTRRKSVFASRAIAIQQAKRRVTEILKHASWKARLRSEISAQAGVR
jgi:hypothetical protein